MIIIQETWMISPLKKSFSVKKKRCRKTSSSKHSGLHHIPQAITLPSVARFRRILSVDQMSGSPIALYEAPRSSHEYRVPRVAESIVFEAHSWLVARGFAVAFYHHTVETCIAESGRKIWLKMRKYLVVLMDSPQGLGHANTIIVHFLIVF